MKRLLIFCLIFGFGSSMTMEKPKKSLKRSYESETESESEGDVELSPKKIERQYPLMQHLVNASDSDAMVEVAGAFYIVGKKAKSIEYISLKTPVVIAVLGHVYKVTFDNSSKSDTFVRISRFNDDKFQEIIAVPTKGKKAFTLSILGKFSDIEHKSIYYNPFKVLPLN